MNDMNLPHSSTKPAQVHTQTNAPRPLDKLSIEHILFALQFFPQIVQEQHVVQRAVWPRHRLVPSVRTTAAGAGRYVGAKFMTSWRFLLLLSQAGSPLDLPFAHEYVFVFP